MEKRKPSTFKLVNRHLESDTTEQRMSTESQMELLLGFYERLAANYNSHVIDDPLKVSVRRLSSEAAELILPKAVGQKVPTRIVVSSSFWSLSVRANTAIIECFIVPATELPTLLESELPSRLKLCLRLSKSQSGAWTLNGVVVNPEELHILLRGLFKDLTTRSKNDYESMPDQMKLVAGGHSFTGSVRSLLAEKHALMQKIVDQQEVIQSQLGRELHDSVLGDVMLLKRSLSNTKRMSDDEMSTVLTGIADSLRQICQELSPRDLKDCGLRAALEELCRNFIVRADCACLFICPQTLPDFSQEIALHIYRITQESLNNAAKHASANNVVVQVQVDNGCFTVTIADDGVGLYAIQDKGKPAKSLQPMPFPSEPVQSEPVQSGAVPSKPFKDGGNGSSIIRERTELIGCSHQAKVWLESPPGKGTKVVLEIVVA